jgi:hypothetical protein
METVIRDARVLVVEDNPDLAFGRSACATTSRSRVTRSTSPKAAPAVSSARAKEIRTW